MCNSVEVRGLAQTVLPPKNEGNNDKEARRIYEKIY